MAFDSGEWLYVEWYDGSDWNELEHYRSQTWAETELTCGSGADNNANFKVRWRVNVDKNPEFANVDDIVVSGTQ